VHKADGLMGITARGKSVAFSKVCIHTIADDEIIQI
jgi:predicted ester cyclase